MKMALIPAVALVGALAFTSPAAAAAQETERVDRTASIRPGAQLRVKNFSGRVTITGSSRGDVAIHAVRRASRERLDHIKLEVRETSSGVVIEANKRDDSWMSATTTTSSIPSSTSRCRRMSSSISKFSPVTSKSRT